MDTDRSHRDIASSLANLSMNQPQASSTASKENVLPFTQLSTNVSTKVPISGVFSQASTQRVVPK